MSSSEAGDPPPVFPPPTRPPAFDIEAALRQVNGRRPILKRLVRIFAEEFEDSAIQLRDQIAQGQIKDAERLAHTLKSAAAALGMADVAVAARGVEAAFMEKRPSDLPPLIDILETALAPALAACTALRDSP